ncbi:MULTISPECIES: hypothetical protein [Pseudarthrobacter]|uniref:hypothetical protein n=1 Tax=Pseudarthrobacter TaxID=1742993 RepID=UPI0013D9D4F0|nr:MULTISPECIES: hypothetical protein [Pseudarthrobacter]MDQ0000082.1 hypothetical protein [Pseudarthrobacter sulfonivorans]
MSGLADRLMVHFLDPVAVQHLLVPAGDTALARARALLTSVYEAESLRFEAVDEVTVQGLSHQVPIAAGRTSRGTWERITPSPAHTLLTLDAPAAAPSDWIDLSLEVRVAVRVSDSGPLLESVVSEEVATLAGADHALGYRLHYAEPAIFVPTDPTVRRTYPLRVCALFLDGSDLLAALRRVAAARREVDAAQNFRDSYEGGAVRSAAAWIAVFDDAAFSGPAPAPTHDDVTRLLATEGIVAAFVTT